MMYVLHYHKNPKLQLSGLKKKKKKKASDVAHGVGRVVGALGSEAGYASSMLN